MHTNYDVSTEMHSETGIATEDLSSSEKSSHSPSKITRALILMIIATAINPAGWVLPAILSPGIPSIPYIVSYLGGICWVPSLMMVVFVPVNLIAGIKEKHSEKTWRL